MTDREHKLGRALPAALPVPPPPAIRTGSLTRTPRFRHLPALLLLAVAVLLLFQSAPAQAQAQAPTTLQLSVGLSGGTVGEATSSFTVVAALNRAATTAVTVTLTATGTATATSDYSLPAAFTIAVGSTSAQRTVTIVNDDIDEEHESIVFSATTSPSLTVTGATATIIDNDTAGVTFSSRGRIVAAGATTTYTVKLDSEPTADVTISPTSGSPAVATVSPASRTFTSQNWQTPQTFTVTGVASGTSTITHVATTSDSTYSNLSIGSVSVTVNDADTVALVSNVNQTQASRGGFAFVHAQAFTTGANSGGYTLDSIEANLHVFSGQEAVLAANVGTIRAELWSDSSGAPNAKIADLKVPSNIVAGDNAFKAPLNTTLAASTTYHVVIYSTNANLNGRVALNNTTTNNEDSGAAAGWSIADTSHYVSANTPSGGSWLSFAAERRIRVKGYANTISTLIANTGQTKQTEGNSLSFTQANAFTTGGNAGGYTLTGIDFHVTATSSLTSTHLGTLTASVWTSGGSAPSGTSITALGTKLADLTVPSSATTGVVTFAAPAGTTLAAGTTYYVVIGSPAFTGDPNLHINTTTSDNEDTGGTTGFSIANVSYSLLGGQWGENGSSVALTFGVKGYARQAPPATLTLTTDASNNTVAEDGGSVTVTATLNQAATTAVSVTLSATGTATATEDYSLPSAFTIPIGSTSATGTLTIVDNDIDEDDETVILTTTVSGYTVTPVTLKITDDDTAGVTVSETTRSVQAAATTTYTVVLDSKPTANVVVGATSGTPANATVSPASYTFTPANWDTPQTFTVTGVQAGSSTITHTATSTDPKYPSSLSIGSVQVTVTAQPPTTLALTTSAASNTAAENGGTVTVTATLNRAATTAVSVTLTATGTATATADYSLPAAFTIPVGSTSGTGTLTIVNDAVDEENETVILTTTVSGLTVTGVTLTITDDDTAGVTVSQTTRDVQDGATTTYTVVLDSKPAANVVVGATSGTPAYATVSPASRTFTTTNWNTPQTFTVTGVASGSSTITHAVTSSSDPKYPTSLSIASVAVRVNPHDTTLSALSFSFSADGGATFPGSGKLTPEFDPATRTYTMELSPSATHVKFTPTANHPEATIEVNNAATASGSASAAIPVSAGRVDVDVTSASRNVVETYRFVLSSGGGAAAGQLGNTVWTSVLIMRDLSNDGTRLGCHSNPIQFAAGDLCPSTTTLSQDTFYFAGAPGWSATDTGSRGDNDWRASRQYGGVRIDALFTEDEGANVPRKLVLSFTQNVPESLRQSLTLVFDGRSFPLREGVIPQNSPTTIEWADTGIARNEHLDDQVVDVGLYLNPVGPSVTEWQPTMRARTMDGGKAGCGGDVDCGDPVVFGGNRFSVDAPKYGGLRSYRITELSVVVVARSGHDEVYRRVRLSVEEHGGTVDLNGATLELTANRQSIRLPIRIQNRVGNTNTWVWELEKSDALSWGPYSTVGVRIIPVTTGLQTVRVYYDEMKNGQPLDDFIRWDIARAKPHATLDQALIAVIPGHFVSINTGEQATTTHARLLLRGDWAGSTITYGVGTYDQPPTSFIAVGAGGLTGAIPLNAEKSNTYVWVRVSNGGQFHTHLVIIDPPPRTFRVNPELRLTEGEKGRVTVSLGSPATRGGVSFEVTTAYGDGVTDDDIGEIVSTVTIPEGQRSASIAVPTIQDEEIEADERLTITLTHVGEPLWAVEPGKTGATTVTIVNDDVGLEPWNIQVVPGDGTLTVTWNVSSREGYEDSEIWHVLRWSQQFGVWANPRDWRAVGRNDGLSVDPGVTSYTITGLKNGVATGVWIRSMVGYRSNMSERDAASSQWVRTKGVHTTPVAPDGAGPRLANPIADATIANERGTRRVPLAGVFTVGGGDLTITASSSNQAVATVAASADGSSLTVRARARGTAQITVTASDGEREASDTFTVTVKTAPRVASALADIGSLAKGTSREVALSRVFADADNDRLRLSASSSATTVATVSLASDGSSLTVSGVAEGKATITVTARDSDGNQVGDTFGVTVTPPPNQAPTVASAIADTTIEREGGAKRVSLAGVFSDADGDDLTITAKSSEAAVATVTVASDQSSLTVTAKKSGTATITVTADDGNDGSVSDAFTVTIATNAAPTVASPIADLSGLRADDARRVSLAGVFSDADNDKLTITAKSSDTAVATVSVAADQSSLTVTAKQSGAATITVTADDGNGGTVSDSFTATVQANNPPTVAAAITDVSGLRADDTRRISLSGVFTDDDGDALTITATSSDTAVATVSVATGQSSLMLTAKQAGTATITVRADDGNGGTVSDSFTVTVAANSAPTVASALGDINELREGGAQQVSLAGLFSDADNDALSISAGSSNDGVATATVNAGGGGLTVTAKQAGTATITVTADDGNGGRTSTTFTVTVEAEPEPQPEPQPEPEPEVETPASSSTEEQDVVARYDADGDGVISYSEYLAAVADVGKGVTYADLVLIRQAWVDGGYKQ